MTFDFHSLLAMARRTLDNPREGANEVMSLGLPRNALWLALAVTALLTTLISGFSGLLDLAVNGAPAAPDSVTDTSGPPGFVIGPIAFAIAVWLSAVSTVFGVHLVGRMFGGTGGFDESLALVAWLQFIVLGPLILSAVFEPISPVIGGLIALGGIVLQFWLLTHFVAALHGFQSLGSVFVMIVLSIFAVISVLAIVLSILAVAFGLIDPQTAAAL